MNCLIVVNVASMWLSFL